MNQKQAISIIEERLLGENSIPVSIRAGEGLNEQNYNELKEAILFLIESYQHKKAVPKVMALAFIDISNWFFVENENYSTSEIERIEDVGIELSTLANQLFE
jgi:hypothetical protein